MMCLEIRLMEKKRNIDARKLRHIKIGIQKQTEVVQLWCRRNAFNDVFRHQDGDKMAKLISQASTGPDWYPESDYCLLRSAPTTKLQLYRIIALFIFWIVGIFLPANLIGKLYFVLSPIVVMFSPFLTDLLVHNLGILIHWGLRRFVEHLRFGKCFEII